MVRKRLGDLVREEAKESSSKDQADNSIALEVEAIEVPEGEEELETEESGSASGGKRSNPTKADLETTVKELKAALQAAESDNNSWQEKNSALQSDLEKQKTVVDKLLIELDEAKQTILKLAQSNSPPAKQENNSPPAKQENNSQPPKIETKSTKSTNLAVRRSPYRPISPKSPSLDFSDSNPDRISNSDLGWFD